MRLPCTGVFAAAVFPLFALEPISPANIARLQVAWTYDTGDSTEPMGPHKRRPRFEATPFYAEGNLYVSTPAGTVVALTAESGKEIWKTDLRIHRDGNYGDFANRGVTVSGNRVYVATVDARLVCLQRSNGRRCSGFGTNGEIDLIAGLRVKPKYNGEYGVTSPPAIYRDLVIVGSAVADNSRLRMASGEVRAFDAASGALRWTFHPLPEDSPAGGANTWSRIVVDAANGLVFLPTGSASPDYFGGLRPGDNRYANSIVALKADSGEIAWHFQTVHHDLWDYDVASPPLLYPGKNGPSVAVGSKTGHLFLFHRLTGKPIFPIAEKRVPSSDVDGEAAAPTQPFPSLPANLTKQSVQEEDLWGATPADLEACRATFRTLRNEGMFTPPSLQGSLIVPGNVGGLHWGGVAWDPANRLLIAPVNNLPAIIRLIPRAQFAEARKRYPERETTEQNGTPYAMSRQFFFSPSGTPCVRPPWGEVVAIQADTGKVAWRVPLGEMGTAKGSVNLGGAATNESGVVFLGAALDGYFRAFDTANGRELWKSQLPAGARSTPLVFRASGGRQMVAIAAGGFDLPGLKLDTKLVVFALSEK